MRRIRTAIIALIAACLAATVSGAPAAAQAGQPVADAASGSVIAFGAAGDGRLVVPPLPAGERYVAVEAGFDHTVLLRSDGTVVAFGANGAGQLDVPPLTGGLRYTAVAAGNEFTVLLRSDGEAVAFGANWAGQTTIPALPPGLSYTAVAAGADHGVLLRSDGEAIGFGFNGAGQLFLPSVSGGIGFVRAAAGTDHTVLVRSDGAAIGVGDNGSGQISLPTPPSGVEYVDAAAGSAHTVLLRSDGVAVAVGEGLDGQLAIPPLTGGLSYTAVAAGELHTVLLRSDGAVIAIGAAAAGRTLVPPLPTGTRYTAVAAGGDHTVLLRSAKDTIVAVGGDALVTAGSAASLTATVTPAPLPGLPYTGSVVFDFGGGITQTVAVNPSTGIATASPTLTVAGTSPVTARYAGSTDGAYRASPASSAHDVVVAPAAPVSLAIAPATASVTAGDALSFAVTGHDAYGNGPFDAAAEVGFTVGGLPFTNGNAITTAGTHTVAAVLASDPSVAADAVVTVSAAPAAAIELTLDAASVPQGGEATATVTAEDAYGNPLGEVSDQVVLSSSHASDQISGRSIRFPSASVHTITATLVTASGTLTSTAQVTVVPAAIAETGADVTALVLAALALSALGGGLAVFSLARRGAASR